jgi:pSer/pThr/pTyr-binding forkhead associated (FHA) protein
MIITVFNNDGSQPEKYSFTGHLVHLGRNPSTENSVTINSTTISRNHLKARISKDTIQIMDLNSSNEHLIQAMALSFKSRN